MVAGCARSVADHPPAEEEHEEAAVSVRVAAAEMRPLEQHVKAIGRCEALLDKQAMLTPALEGQVRAILVEPGATVQRGQAIIELDPRLPAADLAEKQAARSAAAASLALLQSLPRPEEQQVSKLIIEQARVAEERAQSIVDNLQLLAQRNEVSKQQLFDAQKTVEQARLQRESAEKQFEVSMLGPRAEAAEEAKARIGIAQQAAETAQARLDLHTLRAPIDGVLQDVTCVLGQTVAPGTPVGEVVDTRQLYVQLWLPPRAARLVRVGQSAHVEPPAMPPDASEEPESDEDHAPHEAASLPSKVVFIGQASDPQTGNLPVHLLVDNAESELAIGHSVNASIVVHQTEEVLCVPLTAVFDIGEGPVISVVREGKTEHLHPRLGLSHAGWIAVSDTDLKPGEPVVIEGGYNLKEETPVNIEGDEHADEHHDEG